MDTTFRTPTVETTPVIETPAVETPLVKTPSRKSWGERIHDWFNRHKTTTGGVIEEAKTSSETITSDVRIAHPLLVKVTNLRSSVLKWVFWGTVALCVLRVLVPELAEKLPEVFWAVDNVFLPIINWIYKLFRLLIVKITSNPSISAFLENAQAFLDTRLG